MGCNEYINLRKRTDGSTVGKMLWVLFILTAVALVVGRFALVSGYNKDASAEVPWSYAIHGFITEDDVSAIEKVAEENGQRVVFAAMGDFAKVSSDEVTIALDDDDAGTDENDGAKEDRLNEAYLFRGALSGASDCQSFEVVSAPGVDAAQLPWFSKGQLVSGSLDAENPVIIDAFTAATLGVEPMSTVSVEVDVEGKKIVEDLVVTAVVRPTDRFYGICTSLPKVQAELKKQGLPSISAAYIYGESSSGVESDITAMRDALAGASLEIEAAGVDVANSDCASHWDIEETPKSAVAAIVVIALLILVITAAFDARNFCKEMMQRKSGCRFAALVAPVLLDAASVWVLGCIVALLAVYAWMVPTSIYFNWLTAYMALPLVGLATGGLAMVLVTRAVVCWRVMQKAQTR